MPERKHPPLLCPSSTFGVRQETSGYEESPLAQSERRVTSSLEIGVKKERMMHEAAMEGGAGHAVPSRCPQQTRVSQGTLH